MSKLFLLLLVAVCGFGQNQFSSPACSGPDRELADRTFLVICHSAAWKVPVWVGYELKPEHLTRLASRPHRFRRDTLLSHPGASNGDYAGSGFSRGHLAPAADFAWSAEAIDATFLLSNAVPQHQAANAGLWARIEAAVRQTAAIADEVYVFTGVLFETEQPEVVGRGRVAVPTHMWKVLLVVRGQHRSMFAAIVPNADGVAGPLSCFATTVDDVERRAGLDFFAALPDAEEQQLESSLSLSPLEPAALTSRQSHPDRRCHIVPAELAHDARHDPR